VTVVGNDTGGAVVQLLAVENQARSRGSRWCPATRSTTSPPGLTGKALVTAGKLPPALFGASMQQLRLRAARRASFAFGWFENPTVIPRPAGPADGVRPRAQRVRQRHGAADGRRPLAASVAWRHEGTCEEAVT
jgi:hypothetical protein